MGPEVTAWSERIERPKPWDPNPDDTWIRAVQEWSWLPKPDTDGHVQEWVKQDHCTYCGDFSTIARHAAGVIAYVEVLRTFKPVLIPARCTCKVNHPGRENSGFSDGCGKSGWVYYPNPAPLTNEGEEHQL